MNPNDVKEYLFDLAGLNTSIIVINRHSTLESYELMKRVVQKFKSRMKRVELQKFGHIIDNILEDLEEFKKRFIESDKYDMLELLDAFKTSERIEKQVREKYDIKR